jgi:hypothetical protein
MKNNMAMLSETIREEHEHEGADLGHDRSFIILPANNIQRKYIAYLLLEPEVKKALLTEKTNVSISLFRVVWDCRDYTSVFR